MAKKSAQWTLPVEFGGVSIGDETARLGVRIDREKIDLDTADELLCGRRLTCKVATGTNGDSPAQKRHPADALEEITASCDVKRFGVGPKYIGCGLTFALSEIEVGTLAKFAKRNGRLIVESVGEIPEEEAAPDHGADHEGDAPQTLFDKKPSKSGKTKGPTPEIEAAYKSGYDAATGGKKRSACKELGGSSEEVAWTNGYNDAIAHGKAK